MTTACIIGAGTFDFAYFSSIFEPDWRIIAADGGANHLKDTPFIPEKIIADLDSLQDRAYWEGHTTVLEQTAQDSTDVEKCLNSTQADQYLLFGCVGNRFDHTLEVLHILHRYSDTRMIFFVGNDMIFRLPKETTLSLPVGSRISLYPLQATQATSQGLKYPLDHLTLEQGGIIGTSNEATAPTQSIQIKKETLACIIHRTHYPLINTA